MRYTVAILATAVSLGAACSASKHLAETSPSNPPLQWGPAPAVFPAGAQMAVLQGDPSKAEPFTVRLRMPDGYRIAPHTHPTDEHLTIIDGTFLVGMGERVDAARLQTLARGSFATAPAGHPHYAEARGATVVQVNAIGPFALTYVNPADMPRTASQR